MKQQTVTVIGGHHKGQTISLDLDRRMFVMPIANDEGVIDVENPYTEYSIHEIVISSVRISLGVPAGDSFIQHFNGVLEDYITFNTDPRMKRLRDNEVYYRHWKGDKYKFISMINSEKNDKYPSKQIIVYQDVLTEIVHSRDAREFHGVMEGGVKRFTLITEDKDNDQTN